MYRCTERWQANSYLAWLDNIRQKKAGRSSVGNNMIASFQLPLDFCNQLTRRLVRRWKKGRDILVQTAVVLNPVSEVWSLWMDWKQGGKKKKSSAGCWSFHSDNSSVDGKAQNCNHSWAQRHPQPEWCVAHVWTIQMSAERRKRKSLSVSHPKQHS